MTTKKQTSGINHALVQFHSTVPTIPMNGVNPFHRSKYARLEDILKVINKPLTDAGLVIIHRPEGINTMTTEIRHANSGETITTRSNQHPSSNQHPRSQPNRIQIINPGSTRERIWMTLRKQSSKDEWE